MNLDAPFDEERIRRYRLTRVREQLRKADVAGLVLFDPVNIRYATGSRNMQVWTMHNYARYLFVATDGPVILFDMLSSAHLARALSTIDEVRPSLAFDFMMVGDRGLEMAKRWFAEIADLTHTHGGKNRRLAVDRLDLPICQCWQPSELQFVDGKRCMEFARSIKSADEIRAYRSSLKTTEKAVTDMRDALNPGMREWDALAVLMHSSIAQGGEYPETRLLTSGPRTNPWFQETSGRVIEAGELIAFDTDLIGPMGFYTDISRSWVVGERRPSDEQRRLYGIARQQLDHNVDLLRAGIGVLEYSDKSFQLPDEFINNRYADVAHGCGLGVEYPLIWYREDAAWGAYDGIIEADMIMCVECYVGAVDGGEGVKLEQPIWISENGPVLLSDYPLEDDYG